MQSVFVKLESRWVDLVAGEEIDGATLILHFDIFVVADKKACFCEFENVLDVAHRANHLAGRHVPKVGFLSNRGSLNLFGNANLAKRISTVEDSGEVRLNVTRQVSLCVLRVAEDAVSQVAFDQVVL